MHTVLDIKIKMLSYSFSNQTCGTQFGRRNSQNFVPRGYGSVCRCEWDGTRLAINEDEEKRIPVWEKEFLGGMDPVLQAKRDEYRSRFITDDNTQMEWCWRARKIALKSVEMRRLTGKMKGYIYLKKCKKSRRKPLRIKYKRADDEESDSVDDDEFANKLNICTEKRVASLQDESGQEAAETYTERAEQISDISDKKKEFELKRKIVEAQTADDVLELIYDVIQSVGKGLSPNPLAPFNISIALHRIARIMQDFAMPESQRLAFTRQKEMHAFVAVAMTILPELSANGIASVAWAFSKIGGTMLYITEMDRLAEVALEKVSEFSAQNVANVAGAFAAMHHSAPTLFAELSRRASCIVQGFKGQDLAQVLWAFASQNEPADSLLDSLDDTCSHSDQLICLLGDEKLKENIGVEGQANEEHSEGTSGFSVLKFSRYHLGNIAWSYAVFGCLERPFFRHVWNALCRLEENLISGRCREDVMCAAQVFRANQCLKIEYPHLHLSLRPDLEAIVSHTGKTKAFNIKTTSLFQKEVARFLDKVGVQWVKERYLDGYSLDAVLKNRKVALEIDGPSHFSRNLWSPLGHTVLKRRYVKACGWKILIITQQEWHELAGETEQMKYIKELLKGV